MTDARRFPVRNTSGEIIPAHAVMRIVDIDTFANGGYIQVAKPNSDGQQNILINCSGPGGIASIPIGGYGEGHCTSPAAVLYDSGDGTPAAGETWGIESGSWKLNKDKPGAAAIAAGDSTATVVMVRHGFCGASSLTVAKQDGSPSYSGISTLQLNQADGFVVTNPSTGTALVSITDASTTTVGIVSLGNQYLGTGSKFAEEFGAGFVTPNGLDYPLEIADRNASDTKRICYRATVSPDPLLDATLNQNASTGKLTQVVPGGMTFDTDDFVIRTVGGSEIFETNSFAATANSRFFGALGVKYNIHLYEDEPTSSEMQISFSGDAAKKLTIRNISSAAGGDTITFDYVEKRLDLAANWVYSINTTEGVSGTSGGGDTVVGGIITALGSGATISIGSTIGGAPGTNRILYADAASQLATDADLQFDGTTLTGGSNLVVDFGGVTSFELPNSAAPTVNANGEIALDTTVTDWSHGIIRYYGGEELFLVAMPVTALTTPGDGYVVAYNATNDEFELVAGGGGDVTGPGSSTDNAIARWDGTSGDTLQDSLITISDTGEMTFPDNVRQTFNPGADAAGINVGSHAGNPAPPANGDLWYNSSTGKLMGHSGGSTDAVAMDSGMTLLGGFRFSQNTCGFLDTAGDHGLTLNYNENATGWRTLNITTSDGTRALRINGDATISQDYGTNGNPQFATIELGNANDTTLARVSPGVVSIEGVNVVTVSATQTLTNKTLTTPTISGAITFPDNVRQTFNPGADAAGLNVGSIAGDPGTPSNGDLWYDSTANELTARINGANVALGSGGGGGISDGDTLSTGLTFPNTGLKIKDMLGDNVLTVVVGSDLDADYTLTITPGNGSRIITLSGNLTIDGATTISTFGATLTDDADAATARATLGLGTAAVKNTGTSGNTVPLLDGTNAWSGEQTFTNTGLHILDTNATHDLIIKPGSNITADRTLTLTTGDADRTVTISGAATISQDYSTTGNPQFATIELGHASDTTLARSSAGNVTIEGNVIYRAGGTDVAIADGGTGASTAADAFTNLKQAASDTATGVVELAVQSEMETATDTGRVVVPGRQHFHPGHPKAWCRWDFDFGGSPAVVASYKVTNITDNGTGDQTVNWSVTFSAATAYGVNYTLGVTTSRPEASVHTLGTTSTRVEAVNAGSGSLADFSYAFLSCFGDL